MLQERNYSLLDQICLNMDRALRSILGRPEANRPSPGNLQAEPPLSDQERKHSAGLMRVNHAGEICAQALYQGQSLSSRQEEVKKKMETASQEESDHLAWCSQRLTELGSHTSYLNPLWYVGSFAIGLTAGMIGDKWSLGFLAETEHQVVKHLEHQLSLLPEKDNKSAAILKQ